MVLNEVLYISEHSNYALLTSTANFVQIFNTNLSCITYFLFIFGLKILITQVFGVSVIRL